MSESDVAPEFLSVAQVARRLGCSVSLVQKWRRLGWLPTTRLGPPDVPVYGYRPADVERFVYERWNRQRGRPVLAGAAPDAPDLSTTEPFADAASVDGETATVALPAAGRVSPERFKPTHLDPVETAQLRSPTLPALPTLPVRPAQAERAPAPAAPPGAAEVASSAPAGDAGDAIADSLSTTGRPLVLWAGDPQQGTAMLLARFAPGELSAALSLASAWARRYDELVLAEVVVAGEPANILVRWESGERRAPV